MSTPKHTPGPWRVDGTSLGPYFILSPAVNEREGSPDRWPKVLCEFPVSKSSRDKALLTKEECEANAALMAAAPDLLAVVKELDSKFAWMDGPEEWSELCQKAEDAIKKAEGRASSAPSGKEAPECMPEPRLSPPPVPDQSEVPGHRAALAEGFPPCCPICHDWPNDGRPEQ